MTSQPVRKLSHRARRAGLAALAILVGVAGLPVDPTVAQAETIDWLDHSFGDGLQTVDLSAGRDPAAGIAVQEDGKVLVAATSDETSASARNKIVVLRYLADGRPDAGFGTGGKVVLERENIWSVFGLAVQGDGRILVAATGSDYSGSSTSFFYVARLDSSGKLDTTFSAAHVNVMIQRRFSADFTAIALASDGKVVVAGSFGGNATGLVVARLNPDGTIDESFGDRGFLFRPPPGGLGYSYWWERVASVAIQSDGMIIVGGSVQWPSWESLLSVSSWFVLTRVTPGGALDPTFGLGGSVSTDVAGGSGSRSSAINAMTLQEDGKIVTAGSARHDGEVSVGQAVVRYLPDGRLDPGFGSSGVVYSLPPPYGGSVVLAVAVDGKGRIVTGGLASGRRSGDMALTRYTPTGMVDSSFGRSGWMKIDRDTDNDEITALALQPDGAVVFAGSVDVLRVLAFGRIEAPDTSTTIRAWGWNGLGQLGDDSTTQRMTPVPAPGSASVETPAGGGYHSLSLQGDGTVLSVGWNGVGQLGDGTTQDRDTLAPVPGLDNVAYIAAGAHHSLAVRDGLVYAWGWNATGQLGDGTTVDRHTPVVVPGLTGVAQVSAGAYHSLALRNDGTIWAWGWNGVGQLGDGTTVDRLRPVQVPGLSSATAISAGAFHSLAVAVGNPQMTTGGIWSWGWNAMGQSDPMNPGVTVMPSPRPIWPERPIAIAAGGYHNVIIGPDGKLHTWGWNAFGQLGNGTTNPSVWVQVSAIPDPASIAAGGGHTLVTDLSGRTWAWGWNAFGQLGDGTTTDRSLPTLIPDADGAVAMSGGWYHSLGAVSSG